jgi:hypothetical protein
MFVRPLAPCLIALLLPAMLPAADLPVREVTLYKHGVGYFQRAGELQAGDTARVDFKASDMNDVLKSLTVSGAARIAGVRYDASEPLQRRLENFPFRVGEEVSLATFLDQLKGARLELSLGAETVAGAIVSARAIRGADPNRPPERETVVLLGDTGTIRTYDLSAAGSVSLADPKLQNLLRDYLTLLGGARSRDRRSIYLDARGPGRIVASYMTPAAVWKSSYRLIFSPQSQPLLEGWAVIDNTSGEDWSNVTLAVVSGRPISFITQLYEPRYVQRPTAELAENRAAQPVVHEGALELLKSPDPKAAAPPQASAGRDAFRNYLAAGPVAEESGARESTLASTAAARDLGDLFEYRFADPVTVKQGESAMLPFLQQRLEARKLLVYSESYGLHPMNAAEIVNTTQKTLDGGPITVYDAGAYAGEALVETLKAGDKRLISYGVDLGTRISTAWNSARANVREVHFARGVLTTRNAVTDTRTYTIRNVDAAAKILIIEHPQRAGFKLIEAKPSETTAGAYRFEVNVPASGNATLAVKEERTYDQTLSVTTATPDVIAAWIQNRALSETGRKQLEQIAARKREIAVQDAQARQVETDIKNAVQDQDRLRRNIESLRNVVGQQDLVQQYARQLAAIEARLAGLRDRESDLRRQKAALEAQLAEMLENAEF